MSILFLLNNHCILIYNHKYYGVRFLTISDAAKTEFSFAFQTGTEHEHISFCLLEKQMHLPFVKYDFKFIFKSFLGVLFRKRYCKKFLITKCWISSIFSTKNQITILKVLSIILLIFFLQNLLDKSPNRMTYLHRWTNPYVCIGISY